MCELASISSWEISKQDFGLDMQMNGRPRFVDILSHNKGNMQQAG